MKKRLNTRLGIGWLMSIALLLCVITSTRAQDSTYQTNTSPSDSAEVVLNTDDGPHVFWADDTTAIVFYYCNDAVESQTFIVTDTLRFSGLCTDTARQYTIVSKPPVSGPDHIDSAERVFAISDIHGDYDHFVEILIASEVVDSDLHWIWGEGHLVINGDVFDRGPAVTECLWLIYNLEREADRAGGAVHFVLGNHELMVIRGDLRYINERYEEGIARRSRFTYDDLFGAETELGRWLRTKHTAIRINRTLFVHGGIEPEFLQDGKTMTDINETVRSGLDYSTTRLQFADDVKRLYGGLGPLWYRGYIYGIEDRYPEITSAGLDSVLTACDVDEIVVGHSQQDSITTYVDGKVIAIDVRVEDLGGQRALLWQNGAFYRVNSEGDTTRLVR